ncbi:UNVERIFIED_CONTAM: hypothetical protein DQE83_28395, partial [Escherichia coli]
RRYSKIKYKKTLQLNISNHPLNIFQQLKNNKQINLSNKTIQTLKKTSRIIPIKYNNQQLLPNSSLTLSNDIKKQTNKTINYVN